MKLLENLEQYNLLNDKELNIIHGGFTAISTVESTGEDSDCVSKKKGDNCIDR
ncbi:hypothetical protein [Tenacibaculum amylolyticum]|uniref:hypothetical protein n=1 Tax=Tenacibaculum amylolyticum TaxID=104269 RepID=UPI003894E339